MRRLVIRPGGIGDCILSLPALEALASTHTEVWSTPASAHLMSFAGKVRCPAAAGLFLVGFDVPRPAALDPMLRSFDEIVSWYGKRDPRVREALLSINGNIRFLDAAPEPGFTGHMLDFLNAQAGDLTGRPVSGLPLVKAGPVHDALPFAAIQPFASSQDKEWPLEFYAALAKRIAERLPVRWFIAPDRMPLSLPVAGDIVSRRSLLEVAQELTGAAVFIGNDSGLSHLAAAVSVPVVVLFGGTNPALWAPRGRAPVEVIKAPSGRMRDLPVEEVESAVSSLLAGGRS